MAPSRKPLAKPVGQPAASPYRQRVTRASYRVEVTRSQHGDVTRVQYSLRDGTAVPAPPPSPPPPPTPAASGAPEDSSESEASEAANAEAEGSGTSPSSEADAPAESVDSVSSHLPEEESVHAAGSDSEGNTSDEGSGRESGSDSEENSKSSSSEEATSNAASDDHNRSGPEENELADFSDEKEEATGGGSSISSARSVPNLPQPHNTPDDGAREPSSGRAPSQRESHRYGPYVPYVQYEFDNRSDEERRAFPRRAWRAPSPGPSDHAGLSGWRRSPGRARSEPSISDILRERRSASREAVQALPAFVAAAWEHAESGNDPATAEGSGDDISESAPPAGSDAGSAASKVAAAVGESESDSDDSTYAPSSSDGSDGSESSTDASSVSSSSSEDGDEDEDEEEKEKKENGEKEEGDDNSGGASTDNGRSTRSGAPGPSTTSSGASSTGVKRGREEEEDEQGQSTRAKRVRVVNLLAPVEHDPLPLETEPIPFAPAAFVTVHGLNAEVEVWEEEVEQRRLDAANAHAEAFSEDVLEIEAEEREEAAYRAAEGGWRFDDAHWTRWFNNHLVERVRYREAAEHYDYAASVLARLEAGRDAAAPSLEHLARLQLVAARHELGSVEWYSTRDQMAAAVRAAFLDAANAINNHPRARW